LAAILKILKTLSDDLFLCQVSKGSAVWSEYNIFCTLVTMATVAILNFVNPSKAATHYGGYSYRLKNQTQPLKQCYQLLLVSIKEIGMIIYIF
jgi:hypothetical protein